MLQKTGGNSRIKEQIVCNSAHDELVAAVELSRDQFKNMFCVLSEGHFLLGIFYQNAVNNIDVSLQALRRRCLKNSKMFYFEKLQHFFDIYEDVTFMIFSSGKSRFKYFLIFKNLIHYYVKLKTVLNAISYYRSSIILSLYVSKC